MTKKIVKRGRPTKFDEFWEKVVELRLQGKFIPGIAESLGISKPPIYDWLNKGKLPDAEKKFLLFHEEYTRADKIATQKDLDDFDMEIAKMAPDKPDFNKYMDTKSRVKERRNRLHGGGKNQIAVAIKLPFKGW